MTSLNPNTSEDFNVISLFGFIKQTRTKRYSNQAQESLFNTGSDVGDLAKQLFPNGVEMRA